MAQQDDAEREQGSNPYLPVLVRQPGGGSIYSGGVPGNKGGGRRAKALKERAAKLIDDRNLLEEMARIAAGDPVHKVVIPLKKGGYLELEIPADPKARIAAFQALARCGDVQVPDKLAEELAKQDTGIKVFVLTNNATVNVDAA